MANTIPKNIDQPAGGITPPSGIQARIFTMPERYRHGAEGKLHEPASKPTPLTPVEVKVPPVPAPKAPPKLPASRKKISTRKMILFVGLFFLVVFAIGGYAMVQFSARTVREEPEVTIPTPRPKLEAVEPEPTQEPEPEQVQPEATNPFPIATMPGVDTDSDGLTDVEENLVYGTNPKLPDTDADGFLDGNEVHHRYNPSGTAPGTLLESGVVSSYEGPTAVDELPDHHYSLLYPSMWKIQPAENDFLKSPVTLLATSGEKVRISLTKTGEPGTDPLTWYEAEGLTDEVQLMTTKNGYTALLSEDRLVAHIFSMDLVVILTMDTGIKSTIDYLQTFQMILNSVEIL